MKISDIFLDRANRLRSGWRFSIFLLALILAGSAASLIAIGVLSAISGAAAPGTAVFLTVNGLVSLAVSLVIGWLCAKYIEGLPFRSLGAALTRRWFINLVLGLLIGGLTFALAAGVGIASGSLTFRFNTGAGISAIGSTLLISFVIFAAAAAFEEALFRGYMLQTFARSDLALFGAFLTSVMFATVHNANPGATWLSWLNTFLAGAWLAAAYFRTRDLWLPLGLHLAWNWVQGSVFGIEVSGLTDIVKAPLLRESDAGPAWLTGGDYGIEGGVVCTIALIVSILAVQFLPALTPDPEILAMTSPAP